MNIAIFVRKEDAKRRRKEEGERRMLRNIGKGVTRETLFVLLVS